MSLIAWSTIPVRPRKNNSHASPLKLKSGDNSLDPLPRLFDPTSCVADHQPAGAIMAKRKQGSKVQKRAKLRSSAKRGKTRKAPKAAKATKRTVAKAKPKHAAVKKAVRKVKQPVTPVETVAVEVIEQPAPGVITVTEVEETVVREQSLGPG
jgi:hypothetical protein